MTAIGFDLPWWYGIPVLVPLVAVITAFVLAVDMPADAAAARRRRVVIFTALAIAALGPTVVWVWI